MAVIDEVEAIIIKHPGLTETELAKAVHGPTGYSPQVNAVCRTLLRRGRVIRRGKGYADPYRYFPANG
jgi:hypothetical protein